MTNKKGWTRCYIAEVPYNDMKFKWVCSHYDIHLHGTCYYNNEICEFIVDDDLEGIYKIYKLNRKGKIKWWLKQKKFELMVGDHWTYKDGERIGIFYYDKRPRWLRTLLSRIYY
jgi:hypothetical protein